MVDPDGFRFTANRSSAGTGMPSAVFACAVMPSSCPWCAAIHAAMLATVSTAFSTDVFDAKYCVMNSRSMSWITTSFFSGNLDRALYEYN